MLLNIIQGTGQPPRHSITHSPVSVALRLRSPATEGCTTSETLPRVCDEALDEEMGESGKFGDPRIIVYLGRGLREAQFGPLDVKLNPFLSPKVLFPLYHSATCP